MVRQMDIVDGEELLRSQSLYEMIKHTKQRLTASPSNRRELKNDLDSFAKLQQRLLNEQRTRDSIQSLASKRDSETQKLVEQALSSTSEYVNLRELEKSLEAGAKISPSQIIDKDRLFADLRTAQGPKKIQSFLHNYLSTPMDVISIAHAKETVANAPTSNLFDEKLQSQIKLVLDFAEDSLKGVPHARREKITLGEYLQRHNYISQSHSNPAASPFLPDLLKRRLQQLVGETIDTDNSVIDWEFANARTSPEVHATQDEAVLRSLKEGKGLNSEGVVETFLNDELNGNIRDENSLNMVKFTDPITGEEEIQDAHNFHLT